MASLLEKERSQNLAEKVSILILEKKVQATLLEEKGQECLEVREHTLDLFDLSSGKGAYNMAQQEKKKSSDEESERYGNSVI